MPDLLRQGPSQATRRRPDSPLACTANYREWNIVPEIDVPEVTRIASFAKLPGSSHFNSCSGDGWTRLLAETWSWWGRTWRRDRGGRCASSPRLSGWATFWHPSYRLALVLRACQTVPFVVSCCNPSSSDSEPRRASSRPSPYCSRETHHHSHKRTRVYKPTQFCTPQSAIATSKCASTNAVTPPTSTIHVSASCDRATPVAPACSPTNTLHLSPG